MKENKEYFALQIGNDEWLYGFEQEPKPIGFMFKSMYSFSLDEVISFSDYEEALQLKNFLEKRLPNVNINIVQIEFHVIQELEIVEESEEEEGFRW